jgi:hypothetical protein
VATNTDKDVASFEQFLGLRNVVGEESFEPGDLAAALNVDVTDALRLRRRAGYSTALASGDFHSLWSNGTTALVVRGTELLEVLPDFSLRSVRTGLTAEQRVYYAVVGDRVFYSNGLQTGVFQAGVSRSWGLAVPSSLPTAVPVGGNLPLGRYQYTLTYLRADGQESGAPRAGMIELTSPGGIAFEDIPVSTDPDVRFKRLYVSPADGDMMYVLLVLLNEETQASYHIERTGTVPLATQFLVPAPAGWHLAVIGGRVLVAAGNRLYPSEPFAPELFDLRRGVPFASRITLVAPLDDGVYLGTESEIAWLPGNDPAKWAYQPRADYGAIPGTLAYGQAGDVVEAEGPAAFFATTQGICVGLNGGVLINLTNDRFNYPVMDEGSAVVRDSGGSVQYVATLKGTERPGNTAF